MESEQVEFERTVLADLRAGIPEEARGHFRFVVNAPIPFLPYAFEAFHKAVAAILPSVRLTMPVTVVFGNIPFQVPAQGAHLVLTPTGDSINMQIENLVFLDVIKMSQYPANIQVAAVLEELVHAMMNIPDEVLVKHVVAHLFPGVHFNGSVYMNVHRPALED